MMEVFAIAFALFVGQSPDVDPADEPVTNSGETFQDPFANEEPDADVPALEEPASGEVDRDTRSDDSPSESDLPFSGEEIEVDPNAPAPELPPAEIPVEQPVETQDALPGGPELKVVEPPPAPPKEFRFPEVEKGEGPVMQEIIESQMTSAETPLGTWFISPRVGGAFRLNKAPNQLSVEIDGGYRFWRTVEIIGIVTSQFIDDINLGFLAGLRGWMRLTQPPTVRIEWGYGGAVGWTMRAPNDKFEDGRLTVRLQSDLAFYAFPKIALTTTLGAQTFLWAITTDGKAKNIIKSSGPPTQLFIQAGVRFEF